MLDAMTTKKEGRVRVPVPRPVIYPGIRGRREEDPGAFGVGRIPNRWFLRGVAVFWVFLAFSGQPLQAEDPGMPKIRMGYSSKVFADVDVRDAQIAMDMLTGKLNEIVTGSKVSAKCTIYRDPTSLLEAIHKQEIDMLTLTTLDYLRLRGRLYMDPFLVAANQVTEGEQRLLIVRKDRGITKVAQLKDRIVNVPSHSGEELWSLWLDTLLAREGLPEKEKFFDQVRETNKASQAVLPVFFKQSDSAIGKRSAFETLAALNPQLKQDLSIVASSKSLLGTCFCIRRNLDESIKRLLIEKAPKLHESPSGKQLFTLVQVDRIIPFQAAHLDNLIELEREHRALPGRLADRR